MGDFYELFFEDAETAARELQITLTCRNPNAEAKVPMAGVPHHAALGYLSQLLDKGYKVAICDQIEDPKQAKGLVKRAVTRVLTPGTVLEDSNLSAKSHNYLGAVIWDSDKLRGGLAWVDYSTGHWSGIEVKKEPELWQWAVKVEPTELLILDTYQPPHNFENISSVLTKVRPGYFDLKKAKTKIKSIQHVDDLKLLGIDDKPFLTRAMGCLVEYLEETQKSEINFLREFKPLNVTKHLILDEVTQRNLEIFKTMEGRKGKGTLVHAMDKTVTSLGGRLLQTRLANPWRDISSINSNQETVSFFFGNDELRAKIRELLADIRDVERLSTRIQVNRATPRDYVSLRQTMSRLPGIKAIFQDISQDLPKPLADILNRWDDMADLHHTLEKSFVDTPPLVITDGGLFKSGFDPDLDTLINLTEHAESTLQDLLEQERAASEIPKLKLGYNKVFGYYFELSKAVKDQVPEHFIRRQTLVNSERYVTDRLKELEEKLLRSSDDRKDLEYKLFQEIRTSMAEARPRLIYMAQVLAGLDFWQGLAEAARVNDWHPPVLEHGLDISISAGRHPVVEDVQGTAGYVPNNLEISGSDRVLVITGPNMAGKSTVLRQTAIMAIMAQIGSYVPASKARIGVADRIFSRVGASDNLAQGRSTFMVEMMETARILRQATGRSLIILDEIGRGTSTFDGLALARSVVEELSARGKGGIRTLFATHYHELTELEKTLIPVKNLNIAVKEFKGDIVFLRKLVPGPADKSYGIEVAKLAGVPQAVVARAKDILAGLEAKSLKDGKPPPRGEIRKAGFARVRSCSGTGRQYGYGHHPG